jgi:hypothetical protein
LTTEIPFGGTYPADDKFWVPEDLVTATADDYPFRYGDVFATPPADPRICDSRGKPWRAVMALHPSCELGDKAAPDGVQVVRVFRLREVSAAQGNEIRVGYKEFPYGVRIARANTAYLAPIPGSALNEELYADLRKTARVDLAALTAAGRIGVMSHDARLALLRRDFYFRYRWSIDPATILAMERERITADENFKGPRPAWATPGS